MGSNLTWGLTWIDCLEGNQADQYATIACYETEME